MITARGGQQEAAPHRSSSLRRAEIATRPSRLSAELRAVNRIIFAVLLVLGCSVGSFAQKAQLSPGLQTTFTLTEGPKASDTTVLSNIWLYVPKGQSATPFLAPGKFSAEWNGFLSLDIRSEYRFQAQVKGHFKLQLNGAVVLDLNGDGKLSELGQPIRLNKGTNALVATFQSPDDGDGWVRLYWIPKDGLANLIPSTALSHSPSASELVAATRRTLGRELFLENRCFKCHTPSGHAEAPELTLDAPAFDGIGSRRNAAWMAEWIENPKAQRASARMPKVLHGVTAKEDAAAAAAFLATLTDGAPTTAGKAFSPEQREVGQQLFEKLHCAACHIAPDGSESDPDRIALKHVNAKFNPASLVDFLKKPEAHYAWIRMPNFKLSDDEALQLAAYLQGTAEAAPTASKPAPGLVEKGKSIVQNSGCLNCHSAKLDNKHPSLKLADLGADKWQSGCLAEQEPRSGHTPFYGFSKEEAAALRAFADTDRASLTRHVPAEFASRHARTLRCTDCHGKFEGFPHFEIIGDKLKPEWSKAFIAGEVSYKPRPWLESRMPAFHAYAQDMADGLAMLHGLPSKTPAEPPVDEAAAKIGAQLVSTVGGFSCISCHGAGKIQATQVFESAGINLAYTGERMQKDFFFRWLFNPLALDPTTKMPVFFDEAGGSPLTDHYEGDGARQIEALWQYVRMGDKILPPAGMEPTQ